MPDAMGLSRDELRTVAAQLLLARARQLAAEEGISLAEASRQEAFDLAETLLEYVVLLIEANNRRLAEDLRRQTADGRRRAAGGSTH